MLESSHLRFGGNIAGLHACASQHLCVSDRSVRCIHTRSRVLRMIHMVVRFQCTSQGVRQRDLQLPIVSADLGGSILTLVLRLLQDRQADEVRTPDLILGWRAWLDSASGMGWSGAGLSRGKSAMVFARPVPTCPRRSAAGKWMLSMMVECVCFDHLRSGAKIRCCSRNE